MTRSARRTGAGAAGNGGGWGDRARRDNAGLGLDRWDDGFGGGAHSILNAARCARWNAEAGSVTFFMSAEDLTTQAGIAVQQDLALVTLLGLTHVERNGHHYVDGMAARSVAEQRAFLTAHPDLYDGSDGVVRVRLRGGRLAIGSLACPGFASAAEPDWSSLREMPG